MTNTEKQIVVEKIRKINQPEAIRRFFGLLRELIENVNLTNDSRKLAFTVGIKSLKITAYINSHTALQITGRKDNTMLGLVFRNTDLQRGIFSKQKIKFNEVKNNSKYILGHISLENKHLLSNETILQAWTDCLVELESTASASQYRNSHNSFLYDMANDEALRQDVFREVFQNKKYDIKASKTTVEEANNNFQLLDIPKNLMLCGSPGTGKTYKAQHLAASYQNRFVTFHQSFSYEEFIEGIRPETVGGQLRYAVKKGIFYECCLEAIRLAGYTDMEGCLSDSSENRKQKFEKAPPFVLVIDEINRANISKVLGELITLIEPSKRLGMTDEMRIVLPYSQSRFGVPSNLFIVGTMNSADRSIAMLDTALRRRFYFQELLPDYSLLDNKQIEQTNLGQLLRTINERIGYLTNNQHLIGHSYLLPVNSFEDLCTVFLEQIIPLLQEYFYGDWYKIRLILGDNKAKEKPIDAQLVQVLKEYTPAVEKLLLGENLDLSETIVSYQINPMLASKQYDKLPPNLFLIII